MPLYLPLMRNNITRGDLDAVIVYLKQSDPILTQSRNVQEFEEEFSRWVGVKYGVFVNSGSSANLLSMSILKLKHPNGGEVIVPPLTWVSDIASVLQTGFKPVFVDIDPFTLGMDTKQVLNKINHNTRAVFITHVQGFDALTDELIVALQEKNIPLIEDVCESHGATHNGQKLGSFGWMSNFSFYYAHHMSSIEGGMVCTNDYEVYQNLRLLRSHGMVRESNDINFKKKYWEANADLNPDFIFAFPSYNMRNTEIGAILARNQLRRIDDIVNRRNKNLKLFLEEIDPEIFRTDFKLEGCSNYAFNLVFKQADTDRTNRLMDRMREEKIEFRRGSSGGGNQMRQPYLRDVVDPDDLKNYPQVDHIHFHGFYIGNFPDLESKIIRRLAKILNDSV